MMRLYFRTLIMFVVLCCIFEYSQGQIARVIITSGKSNYERYGFYVINSKGKDGSKRQLKNNFEWLQLYYCDTVDKLKKITREQDKERDRGLIEYRQKHIILEDSLYSTFKIIKITKKKNNYYKEKNKLKKKTIFLIDIECINDTLKRCPQFIRLISIDTLKLNYKKIQEGEEYRMKIFSFFEKDCCHLYKENGDIIYIYRAPNSHPSCIMFENIWIVYIDISSWNYFETPNLKGLYYVETDETNKIR